MVHCEQDMSGEPYPVMFFLYGGSYQSGYNTQYWGHFLAAHDVVIVIPNYRVNRFSEYRHTQLQSQ